MQKRLSFGTVALGVLESGFCMGGHYLRELAVLVVVFVPIDYWRHDQITAWRIVGIASVSILILLCGMVCEWTSYGVKRGKQFWEKEESA